MNLGVTIANLLRRYPAVGVPGIGVFKRIHDPASYDAVQAVFLPPIDRIELVEDDPNVFSITTYLAAQRRIDRASAVVMLETVVKDTMEAIARNGEVLLDGLGYLFAGGRSVAFRPFEAGRLLGKPVVIAPPSAVDEAKGTETISEYPHGPSVNEPEVDLEGEEHTVRKPSYVPWVVAATVALLLIVTGTIWYNRPAWFGGKSLADIFVPKPEANQPIPSDEAIPLMEVKEDSGLTDSGQLSDAPVDSVPTGTDSVLKIDDLAAKPSVTYEIIVGSFATMQQANKFVAEMKAKGYDLQAIDSRMPGNRKKISWGSFATEEEAYKELARVQKTFEPGAWIAKVTHD